MNSLRSQALQRRTRTELIAAGFVSMARRASHAFGRAVTWLSSCSLTGMRQQLGRPAAASDAATASGSRTARHPLLTKAWRTDVGRAAEVDGSLVTPLKQVLSDMGVTDAPVMTFRGNQPAVKTLAVRSRAELRESLIHPLGERIFLALAPDLLKAPERGGDGWLITGFQTPVIQARIATAIATQLESLDGAQPLLGPQTSSDLAALAAAIRTGAPGACPPRACGTTPEHRQIQEAHIESMYANTFALLTVGPVLGQMFIGPEPGVQRAGALMSTAAKVIVKCASPRAATAPALSPAEQRLHAAIQKRLAAMIPEPATGSVTEASAEA